jgi:hypothetical protein
VATGVGIAYVDNKTFLYYEGINNTRCGTYAIGIIDGKNRLYRVAMKCQSLFMGICCGV